MGYKRLVVEVEEEIKTKFDEKVREKNVSIKDAIEKLMKGFINEN